MKKTLSLLTLCLGLCCVSCYDDTALVERIEALETTQIASINEQISAIHSSIADLEATDRELDALILDLEKEDEELQGRIESLNASIADLKAIDAALQDTDAALRAEIDVMTQSLKDLEAEDKELQACIDSLTAKDTALEARIEELKAYVEAELASTKDWANATFATLEQYEATCAEVAAIKVLVADLEASLKQSIADAVAASEAGLKDWVNEQLTGYWTIAETQAKLVELRGDAEKEFASIEADLKTATDELTAAYKSAIAEAIESSEGKLSTKIDEVNAALEKKIADIEARLTAVEEKLAVLTREFAITFNDTEIGIVPGGVTSVDYTIVGATDKTIVKAFGQNGWSARVAPDGADKGTITVTAPDPITDDEIIVLVYDGEYRAIMSTVDFVEGYATPSQTAVEFSDEADTVSIELTSNLSCHVSIPEEARSWLSVVEPDATRAIYTQTVRFACTECIGGIRKATVTFVDDAGMPISTMVFVQRGSAVIVTLAEAGTLEKTVDKSLYRDIKGLVINGPINAADVAVISKMYNLEILDLSNATIVAGEEYAGENVIGTRMFQGATFTSVILPANLTKIGGYAFEGCKLKAVTIPASVKEIGTGAFLDASELQSVTLHEGLEIIGGYAFHRTGALESLVIPSTVRQIGEWALGFSDVGEIHLKALPTTLTEVGSALFYWCSHVYNEKTLYIPKGTLDAYSVTDFGRFRNIVEE